MDRLDFDDFLGSGDGQTEIASRHIAPLLVPAKSRSRFLLPISSRQIDESISIADFFPPNESISNFYSHHIEVGVRCMYLQIQYATPSTQWRYLEVPTGDEKRNGGMAAFETAPS